KTSDVMPQIVQNPGSRLFAQRINTPHVAQNWSISIRFHSDVMHAVEGNQIICRQTRSVSPSPSNRNACVIEIVNQIMHDSIVRRLPNPDPNRACEHISAVVNVAINDFVKTALLSLVLTNHSFTNLNPSRAKIAKVTSHDSIAYATSPQLNTI